MAITSERVEFLGHDGKSQLAERLDSPDTGVRATALFAHCFTCSKDIHAATRIAAALTEHGFAVLRFDFTGLGASEGEFANTNFSSNVGDLIAAAQFMEKTLGHGPEVLVGHSLGGAAVLAAAHSIPSARAVATIGAPADPGHVAHLFDDQTDKIVAEGEARVKIGGRGFTIQKQFLDDIAEQKVHENLSDLGKALLIFHAPGDATVGIDNAATIFGAAKHPKSFVSLDDADHLVSRPEDATYVANVLSAWAGRYITEPSTDDAPIKTDSAVLVTEINKNGLAQSITAGNHSLIADEPEKLGGTDKGFGPYDLLLSGLGACTAMTLRMYANHKGWPLEGVSVALDNGRVHRDDCDQTDGGDGKIYRIVRKITLTGSLDGEQRIRLLEIADKCPVHKTLSGPLEIVTLDAQKTP